MTYLVLIGSAIKIAENKKGFSYSSVKSVFTTEERYKQTLNTIKSARQHFKNCKIIIIENSPFKWQHLSKGVFSFNNSKPVQKQNGAILKGLFEGGSFIELLESNFFKSFMKKNKDITQIHKIAGRYYFDDLFVNSFASGKMTFFRVGFPILISILNDRRFIYDNNNVNTCYYNLDPSLITDYLVLMKKAYELVAAKSYGYEVAVAKSIKLLDKSKFNKLNRKAGIRGFISVDGRRKEVYV